MSALPAVLASALPPAADAKGTEPGVAPTSTVSFEAVLESQLGLQPLAKPLSPDLRAEDAATSPQKSPPSKPADGDDPASAQPLPGPLLFLPVIPPLQAAPGVAPPRPAAQQNEVKLDPANSARRPALPNLLGARGNEEQPEIPAPASSSMATMPAAAANVAAPLRALPAPVEGKEVTATPPDPAVPPGPVANPPVAETEPKPTAPPPMAHAMAAVPGVVGDTRWGDALSQRVVWMAGEKLQVAQFRVEPPQLGPIEVRMSITNDQANLLFTAAHAEARDAIQNALPRLQEMLVGSGLALGNVSIGAGGGQDQTGPEFQQYASGADPTSLDEAAPSAGSHPIAPSRQGVGLVDLFA